MSLKIITFLGAAPATFTTTYALKDNNGEEQKSEFVSMIDWIAASDRFVETGDARQLSQLLNPHSDSSGANKKAAETLFDVSLATLLCRPLELGN